MADVTLFTVKSKGKRNLSFSIVGMLSLEDSFSQITGNLSGLFSNNSDDLVFLSSIMLEEG